MPFVIRPEIVKDIIGKDLVFPLNYDQKGDLRLVESADENLHQAIFLTIFTTVGERILRREFGTTLSEAVFKKADQSLANQLKSEVQKSLDRHEFRIDNIKINATVKRPERNRIDIEVYYTDLKYRHENNLIFPYYLEGSDEK